MNATPKSFDALYPGRFLKAGLLDGRKVTLTISDVALEDLEGEKGTEKKAILSFSQTPMKLVLCKLNGLCIKAMFGPKVPEWIGKKVTLYPTADIAPMKRGEECIRIWGSPDLECESRQVEIRLPKRKAFVVTLRKTPSQTQETDHA